MNQDQDTTFTRELGQKRHLIYLSRDYVKKHKDQAQTKYRELQYSLCS